MQEKLNQIIDNLHWWQDKNQEIINHELFTEKITQTKYTEQVKEWLSDRPELLQGMNNFCTLNFNAMTTNYFSQNNLPEWYLGFVTPNQKKPLQNVAISYQGNKSYIESLNRYISFNNFATWYTPNLIKSSSRRKQENVVSMHCLYMDLDLIKASISIEEGIIDIYNRLINKGLPLFDCLIDTGHGIQIYWYFKHTDEIQKMIQLNTALAMEFQDLGVDLKVSQDTARYMRMPFTTNIKKEYAEPVVSALLYFNPELTVKNNFNNLKDSQTLYQEIADKIEVEDFKIKNVNHTLPKATVNIEVPKLPEKFSSDEEKQEYLLKVERSLPKNCVIATTNDEGKLFKKYYLKHPELFEEYNMVDEHSTRNRQSIADSFELSGYSLNSIFELLDIQKSLAEAYRKTGETYRNNLLMDRAILLTKLPDFRPVFIDFALFGDVETNKEKINQAIQDANLANYQRYLQLQEMIFEFNDYEFKEIALSSDEVANIFENRDLFSFAKYAQISRFKLMNNEGNNLPFYQEIIKKAEQKFKDNTEGATAIRDMLAVDNSDLNKLAQEKQDSQIEVQNDEEFDEQKQLENNQAPVEVPEAKMNETDVKSESKFNIDNFSDMFSPTEDEFVDEDEAELEADDDFSTSSTEVQGNNNLKISETGDEGTPQISKFSPEELKKYYIKILKNNNLVEDKTLKECLNENKEYLQQLLYIRSIIIEYNELPLLDKIANCRDEEEKQELLKLLKSRLTVKIIEERYKKHE